MNARRRWAAQLLAVMMGAASACAGAQTIVLASTTSTEHSGLFKHLLPRFRQASGVEVRVIALGTGQALDLARRGDADVLLVHDELAEEAFVREGHGLARLAVMSNDFVLIGPRRDPAGVRGLPIDQALKRLSESGQTFISRGDRSGTHAAELRQWARAGTTPSPPMAYRECGCGMGAALNMAAAAQAYVLSDRATWLAFRNRADLELLVDGDPSLHNPYAVIVVNPQRHPHARVKPALAFADWLRSPAGQDAISAFRIDGEVAFKPVTR